MRVREPEVVQPLEHAARSPDRGRTPWLSLERLRRSQVRLHVQGWYHLRRDSVLPICELAMKNPESPARRIVEKHLGSLEAQIMRILWERPSLPVRDVVEALPGRRARAYTTVMTVMNRLTGKGLLKRRPEGRAYVYMPTVSEEEFVEQLTRSMVRSLINDFGDVAVANFVGELRDTDPGEFQRLRELVEREGNESSPQR